MFRIIGEERHEELEKKVCECLFFNFWPAPPHSATLLRALELLTVTGTTSCLELGKRSSAMSASSGPEFPGSSAATFAAKDHHHTMFIDGN